MEKLISEHRKQLGNFEVIDFVDEQEIARLRAQIDVKVPMELHWTWNYGSEVAELRNLYEKGKQNQWNAEVDLDWSVPVSKDEWVLNPQASMLAQVCAADGQGRGDAEGRRLRRAELPVLAAAARRAGRAPALRPAHQRLRQDGREVVRGQPGDRRGAPRRGLLEAPAAQVRRRSTRSGRRSRSLLDILLEAESAQKKTLGMQTLFEGMAVGIMDLMRDRVPQPADRRGAAAHRAGRGAPRRLRRADDAARGARGERRREERHGGLGLPDPRGAERQPAARHAAPVRPEVRHRSPTNVTQMFVSLPNFAELNSMPYMHTVVPNLRNLGLITERTEGRWRELGMMVESAGREGRARDGVAPTPACVGAPAPRTPRPHSAPARRAAPSRPRRVAAPARAPPRRRRTRGSRCGARRCRRPPCRSSRRPSGSGSSFWLACQMCSST